MWKIIYGSIKFTVRNLELVWVLFFTGIIIKYLTFGLGNPAYGLISTLKSVILVIFKIYLLSATLAVLCLDKKFDKWNWKNYLKKGFKNLPFMVLWVFFIVLVTNLLIYLIKITTLKSIEIFNIVFFAVIGYITAVIPVAHSAGVPVEKTFKRQVDLIKRIPLKWIITGLYIFFVVAMTQIVIYTLWGNIIALNNKLLAQILVLCVEFIRSFVVVAIMSTIVLLTFDGIRLTE